MECGGRGAAEIGVTVAGGMGSAEAQRWRRRKCSDSKLHGGFTYSIRRPRPGDGCHISATRLINLSTRERGWEKGGTTAPHHLGLFCAVCAWPRPLFQLGVFFFFFLDGAEGMDVVFRSVACDVCVYHRMSRGKRLQTSLSRD